MGIARGQCAGLGILEETLHQLSRVPPCLGHVADLLRRSAESVAPAHRGVLVVPGGLADHLRQLLPPPEEILRATFVGAAHAGGHVLLSSQECGYAAAFLGHELTRIAHQAPRCLTQHVGTEACLVERCSGRGTVNLCERSTGIVVPGHAMLASQFVKKGDCGVPGPTHGIEQPHRPADHALSSELQLRRKITHGIPLPFALLQA